jgi:hypothetical protein
MAAVLAAVRPERTIRRHDALTRRMSALSLLSHHSGDRQIIHDTAFGMAVPFGPACPRRGWGLRPETQSSTSSRTKSTLTRSACSARVGSDRRMTSTAEHRPPRNRDMSNRRAV